MRERYLKAKAYLYGQKNMLQLDKVSAIGWLGCSFLFIAPYLIETPIGYYLLAFGIACLIPQSYKARHWNLVVLNVSSVIGYTLQILNLI